MFFFHFSQFLFSFYFVIFFAEVLDIEVIFLLFKLTFWNGWIVSVNFVLLSFVWLTFICPPLFPPDLHIFSLISPYLLPIGLVPTISKGEHFPFFRQAGHLISVRQKLFFFSPSYFFLLPL